MVRYVLGLCVLMALPSLAMADACSDLQAAIAKAAALKGAMQREAAPLLMMSQLPARNDAACKAAQDLRDQIVILARLIDSKCLNEEQMKSVSANVSQSMTDANNNIGLFCQ